MVRTVFLRALEYYSGILIMTTTRVGTVDEAFRSRIHLTLYFPPLDRAQFLKIWEIAFHRVQQQNVQRQKKIKIEMREMMRTVRKIWLRSKGNQSA